ncbi:histidine phosphatase family protein [Bacillus sp. DX1.1]|uniref:histidine phosphatase family protein n=1 Tax=unclassified Bacillus (in: firmicutes) TaxID=185979 RepID=UPI0025700267|nr:MULTISPECIES: histidine phosphatase family protein [unclassified Bacillus (in: firmicutes)]MDM5155275.1 histidine phosphatase family protein [Bacillus sp. DX1.1]WJE79595.1 histidine phosphatase family protein [Bacillus sp. DX3.1]
MVEYIVACKQAAEVVADTVSCPVKYLDELREMNNGESKLEFRLHGEQIVSFIKENSKQYKRIVIISHGGMITKIVESFLQLPTVHDIWFHTDHTGIHLLEYTHVGRLIRFTNSTTHLKNTMSPSLF